MLRLEIGGTEFFNEETQEFEILDSKILEFEHSLVSLSKWESYFEKPFIATQDKTDEQVFWYIRAMCLTPDVAEDITDEMTQANFDEINRYISSKATATWFADHENSPQNREIITAEIIYYWMIALQIPFECQHWHINRLMTLIKVCNEKNTPPEKRKRMSQADIARRNRELNAQRRAQMGTSG